MPVLLELVIALLLLTGALFTLIGAIGLVKLTDFYMRLHAPTKATTLGLGAMLIGSMLYFTQLHGELSVHELLIALFLFLTAPVSAHMLAKAALHLRLPTIARTSGRELVADDDASDPRSR